MALKKQSSKQPAKQQEGLTLIKMEKGGFNPNRIRMLVYGESGIGKTRFASTWPEPIFLDIDDGLASVDRPITSVHITSWEELHDMFDYLSQEEHPYKTAVIDSLNEAQILSLGETVAKFPNVRRAYDSLAGQSDYGKMLADFDDMLRDYKSLTINLILIAQVERRERDTDTARPQLLGKSTANNVARMCDIIGYLYREGGVQKMGFAMDMFNSKDRSGSLPPVITNPTYAKLAKYWRKKEI